MPMVLCSLCGCLLPEPGEQSSFMKRFQEKTISPDHALIELAILERPIGDDYINCQVWKNADELLGDSDRRAALEENGFRIGQLVGPTPGDLQEKLLDKQVCSNPKGLIFPAGQAMPIILGSMLPQSSFDLVMQKRRTEVNLDQVRYCLEMTAHFTSDGRTKLTFTPKVENGEAALPFEAVPERQRWEVRIERPSKKYPELSWDVVLAPNQYFIVGARMERDRTLGQIAFTQDDGDGGVQRLLVIRNCRSVTALEAHQNSVEEMIRADRTPPLALRATLPISRAKSH